MKKSRIKGLTRIAYGICYAILVIYLSMKIKHCIENFLQGTTFFDTSMVKQDDTRFPEITLCSKTPYGLKNDVLEKHGLNYHKYTRQWTSNNTNITPQALWNLSTFDLAELISKITVRTWADDAFPVLETRNSVVSLKNISIKVQRSLPFGQCYTLQLNTILRTSKIRQVEIKWFQPGTIVVHTPNLFLNNDQRKKYVLEHTRTFVFLDYTDIKYMLTEDTRKEDQHKMPCSRHTNWDEYCIYNNAQEDIGQSGCTSPWVMNNSNICKDLKEAALMKEKYRKLLVITPSRKECLIPCNQMAFDITWDGYGKISDNETVPVQSLLNFKKWIKKHEEKLIYTELNLLAEIGGYVGIFLGYSLLNLADNVYNFINTR